MTQDRRKTIQEFVERAYKVLDEVSYYQLLTVPPVADLERIRQSYYKLATSLHPDVHGLDLDPEYRKKLTAVFSRVAESYKVLVDPDLRARYDRGLAKGIVRIGTGTELKENKIDISDSGALRFYNLGISALSNHDLKSAILNLTFAEQVEPNSESIKAALAKARGGET